MTRDEAIKEAGTKIIKAVEAGNLDYSILNDTYGNDILFSTTFDFTVDDEIFTIEMVVGVSKEEHDAAEDLDQIDWCTAIQETAQYEIY